MDWIVCIPYAYILNHLTKKLFAQSLLFDGRGFVFGIHTSYHYTKKLLHRACIRRGRRVFYPDGSVFARDYRAVFLAN